MRAITDASGAVVVRHDYQPFGVEWASQSATGESSVRFAGKERDPETGTSAWGALDYSGARFVQSQLGRFLTPDASRFARQGEPQTWNQYGYVGNSPMNNVDWFGHEDCPIGPKGATCSTAITVVGKTNPLTLEQIQLLNLILLFQEEQARKKAEVGAFVTAGVGVNDTPQTPDSKCDGWFKPEGHIYTVGSTKAGPFAPGRFPLKLVDDYVPAGHAFGTRHDQLVGDIERLTGKTGGPVWWIANILTMPGAYVLEVAAHELRTDLMLVGLTPRGRTCHP